MSWGTEHMLRSQASARSTLDPPLLCLWPQAGSLSTVNLNLSFLLCKMEIIPVYISQGAGFPAVTKTPK